MAGEIKLFLLNKKYYRIAGIDTHESYQNSHSLNSKKWIFMAVYVLYALPSASFFVLEAKYIVEYSISLFAILTAYAGMAMYLTMGWRVKITWSFIENFERFIEKRQKSINVYRGAVDKFERLSELVCNAFIFTVVVGSLPLPIYAYFNYYILDLGEESFLLTFPEKWPFSWKTPQGFFVTWLVQFMGLIAIIIPATIFLNLMIGSCWLYIVMTGDIVKDVVAYNKDVKANAKQAKWMERFCGIVQIYSDAKQIVFEFNEVVKYSLFTLIVFFLLSISSTLLALQFQLDLETYDQKALIETFAVAFMAFWVFGGLFVNCELGERVCYHFDLIQEELQRCCWYKTPFEMQQMYLILLSDTQQPKHITCFGNIQNSRETFKKMTTKGFSYFMSLRKFH